MLHPEFCSRRHPGGPERDFRGTLVPFIGKTIAAAQISFRQHNEALKKRAEAPCKARTLIS